MNFSKLRMEWGFGGPLQASSFALCSSTLLIYACGKVHFLELCEDWSSIYTRIAYTPIPLLPTTASVDRVVHRRARRSKYAVGLMVATTDRTLPGTRQSGGRILSATAPREVKVQRLCSMLGAESYSAYVSFIGVLNLHVHFLYG